VKCRWAVLAVPLRQVGVDVSLTLVRTGWPTAVCAASECCCRARVDCRCASGKTSKTTSMLGSETSFLSFLF